MGKSDKPKLLLKLGTSTLTKNTPRISRAKLEDIAAQVIELRKDWDVILVVSGAIAAAKQFLKLEKLGDDIQAKQAMAAIGQPFLMRLIYDSFHDYEIPVGQCLISYADFSHEISKNNIKETISVLLQHNILPIINENDTTATDEIKFGDNDKLSALVARLVEAKRLILATNTYGIYDNEGNTIPIVTNIDDIRKYIQTEFSSQGTGGMVTKLEAAEIAQKANIETWIVYGHEQGFVLNAIEGKGKFTRVV